MVDGHSQRGIIMATVYLNWKGPQGRETVDELSPEPRQSAKEFRAYVREMCSEYALAGLTVYPSIRACVNWKESE